jgi:hypothetical protein
VSAYCKDDETRSSVACDPSTLNQPSRNERSFVHKRILLGIMSADFPDELAYRDQFRKLFQIFAEHQDSRVCSLGDFLAQPESRHGCQLVYTFVLGGNPDGPTELVNDSLPLLVPNVLLNSTSAASDKLRNDMTVLNIRENMEEGKSQTWIYRAQQLMRDHRFDYVAKCDSDSVLDLVLLFQFSDEYLPPPPYNRGIIAGKPCDKLWWRMWRKSPTSYPPEEKKAKEGFLRERYGKASR